jgi:hypothetical protein
VVAARALGADSRKLVPKFSDDAAPSRRAEVSVSRPCLEWPSKSPEGRDSGRSAVSAGISVYAPSRTFSDLTDYLRRRGRAFDRGTVKAKRLCGFRLKL